MRDRREMAADFAHWKSLPTAKEQKQFLSSIGLNTMDHAFTRVPYFDVSTYVPYDFMHGELEGTLKNELAAMIYYFVRHRPSWGFSIDKVNEAIRNYPWPGGYAPPTFTKGYLEKGTTEGAVKKGTHVHMTAGDVLIFVRHSVDLLQPLIGDTSDPLWQCWLVHCRYVRLLLQHEVKQAELLELDELIYRHHQLFLEDAKDEYGESPPPDPRACMSCVRVTHALAHTIPWPCASIFPCSTFTHFIACPA